MPGTLQVPRETSCEKHLILSLVSWILAVAGSSFSTWKSGFLSHFSNTERFSLKTFGLAPPWNASRLVSSRTAHCKKTLRGFWGTNFCAVPCYIILWLLVTWEQLPFPVACWAQTLDRPVVVSVSLGPPWAQGWHSPLPVFWVPSRKQWVSRSGGSSANLYSISFRTWGEHRPPGCTRHCSLCQSPPKPPLLPFGQRQTLCCIKHSPTEGKFGLPDGREGARHPSCGPIAAL